MQTDGTIIIGTELDESKFDKQINNLEKKASNKEIDIEITSRELSEAENKLNDINDKLDYRIAREKEIKALLEEENSKQYKASSLITIYKEQLSTIADEQLKLYDAWNKQNLQVDKLTGKLDKQKNDLVLIQKELNSLETNKIKDNLNNITSGTTGIVKKVTKWGLLLMGVRSIYGYIRNAISQVTQEDQNLQNQIQYISFAIGTALKPVVEWLVNEVYKLLSLFGAIVKLITGFNIFSKATAKNFNQANKSVGEMKKTLAGFDEMNIIGGGGGTGILGDIQQDFGKIRDLSDEVEKLSEKLKGPLKAALIGAFRFPTREEVTQMTKPFRDFWGGMGSWLKTNWLDPAKLIIQEFVNFTKPVWEPIANAYKQAFGPLVSYVNDKVLTPISDKFTTFKDKFLSKYASFINKIIYFINMAFGVFGIQLEYIDEESAITGKDISKNINDKLDETRKKVEGLESPLQKIINKFKELTSKTWNVATNFVLSGKDKLNRQLDPLRETLSKIGIKLPYLAKGGIINMPGRGVLVGSAIGGEKGMEGVIPLTDSQQMMLLGEAIGKYITMNATVPVYIGNRLVMREMKRIEAEDAFAYNR